ncbi:MAG: efflux RND transporter permease subunit [Fimbriimonas ginsengisoli]|uniref:Efflux RND transporter permease subunit n=1 Tax=Fimbriimonas ginsengisoli TaxID=1005039 RepID=A0A931PT09_FIMGI|nr:efflux RND transporter permease subunit [Fimbriimonas ginsengisoli]
MGLTRTALTRPVFIFMLMAAAFLLGTLSYFSMRLEQNPEVTFGVVTVSTVYPGAGPEEINNLVSRKIEESISGVNGIREVTSTSREGVSTVVANFDIGINVDTALSDVRSKVDAITGDLPKDALKPEVSKFDTTSQPVLFLSFSSQTMSSRDLRDLIDQKLKDRFGQIGGVAAADVIGGDQREIQVRIKKDRLLALGVGINDVQRAIQAANLNAPSGRLLSGAQEYSVRVLGEFKTVDDIRNMAFTVSDPKSFGGKGQLIRLGDVADVQDTAAERTSYSRLDGKDSILLIISKAREGNAVEITNAADGAIRAIEQEYRAQGLHITKTLEAAKNIRDSLGDLNVALMFGIFLVAVIVYVFLHNFRGTLIVGLAIPTSIFATFVALKLMGFTINNMSMLSLSLAIGVLVDDAIVVLENIYRHLKKGEKPFDAALNGRSEIGLAAIAITMADVVVFLPIAFMGGIVGQFFKPLALGFVCATLFSLFVSFTLTPLLASRWYREGEDMEHPTGRFAIWFEHRWSAFESAYRRGLEWGLNHRWFVFILGNITLVAVFTFIGGGFKPTVGEAFKGAIGLVFMSVFIGFVVFVVNVIRGHVNPRLILYGALFGMIFPAAALAGYAFGQYKKEAVFKFAFLPATDSGAVSVTVELPPGTNLKTTQAVVSQIEDRVRSQPDIKYMTSNVGTQGSGGFGGGSATGSNYAQVLLTLNDKAAPMDKVKGVKPGEKMRTRPAEAVASDVMVLVGSIPGAFLKVSTNDSFGFGAAIQIGFASEDRDLLVRTVTNIRQRLREGAIKGVINPDLSSKPGKPELQALPDRTLLADNGLSVAEVGAAMRTLYQGNDDSKLRVAGREYPIRVMMDRTDRDNPDLVQQVPLKFNQGNPVFLSSVAPLREAPALDKIERRARQEEIRVTADLLPGYAAGSVQQQINDWLKTGNLVPAGVNVRPLGQADAQAREMPYMLLAFMMGPILVYMLLASLFDNFLYPFVIQLAQPQAMVGALLALVITDKTLSLVGFIGLVTLVGLVGKNAILLVDYTNTLRGRGRNRHDALVEAGPVRLRPIMMTTSALVLGMLPVALAIGRGSEFRETLGISIIGGIALSTMLTLFVIPCSYTVFDDISESLMRRKKRRREEAELNPNGKAEGIEVETEARPGVKTPGV